METKPRNEESKEENRTGMEKYMQVKKSAFNRGIKVGNISPSVTVLYAMFRKMLRTFV